MDCVREAILDLLTTLEAPGVIVSIRSEVYKSQDILYGYSNLETMEPMSTSLLFPIGSVTKTFTGTMLLQAYDAGLVNLHRSVNSIFLGINGGEYITIRDVGDMRSGIYNYTETELFQEVNVEDPYRVWSPSELLSIGLAEAPYFEPGSAFHYSNTNSVILGLAVERLFNDSYEEILYQQMLEPLELHNTSFKQVVPLAGSITGYTYVNDELVPTTGYNNSWGWSAGQIISNVLDMHKYAKKSLGQHKTLSKDATLQQRRWSTLDIVDGVEMGYGFQLEKLNNYIGHRGSLPGYSSYVLCNVPTRTTIVIVANLQTSKDGVTVVDPILRLLLELLPGL